MTFLVLTVCFGLLLLVWSANQFVDGASAMAKRFGVPALLIGMLIIGFGTSLPELMVSAQSAYEGKPGLAIGNAYGSNIGNIALILGLTALLRPVTVQSRVLRTELPVLAGVSVVALSQAWDLKITPGEAVVLLSLFGVLFAWSIWKGSRTQDDAFSLEMQAELAAKPSSIWLALIRLIGGLLCLLASSRMLVWGASQIAISLGVSDLVIGLTIVAIGTSLPELASSIAASRKGEHDIVLGNLVGSNLFNTLAVVGLAGAGQGITLEPAVLYRDLPIMLALTLSVFVLGYGWRGPGRINRVEGTFLLLIYSAYLGWLFRWAAV